jgi:BirA family transcriptional regulator, biotin operon repressor / biotin---[acetyl-CoA-carboxylase] ligase
VRVHVAECESTQSLLDPSMPEWSVATTDHQTGGRGRLGRTWVDEPGTSLLVSVLLKPPPGRKPAELTLVAGLAVAQVVERALGRPAEIKWPNDVLVGGAKVSGGLADLRDGAVVLGIGVNVNQTALPEARAASLRTIDGRERALAPLLEDLLATLRAHYGTWRDDGLAALHNEIAARDYLRGRSVEQGTVIGIRPDGRLELDSGIVESGEVVILQT